LFVAFALIFAALPAAKGCDRKKTSNEFYFWVFLCRCLWGLDGRAVLLEDVDSGPSPGRPVTCQQGTFFLPSPLASLLGSVVV